jgi:hypothetical protein
VQIRFVPWEERIKAERKNIWHWTNEDGAHHYCRTQAKQINDEAQMHIDSILEG